MLQGQEIYLRKHQSQENRSVFEKTERNSVKYATLQPKGKNEAWRSVFKLIFIQISLYAI